MAERLLGKTSSVFGIIDLLGQRDSLVGRDDKLPERARGGGPVQALTDDGTIGNSGENC